MEYLQWRDTVHTCYRPNCLRILAPDQENDVPLALVDIVVLKEEQLVDSIFLERAELDEKAYGACK